MANNEGKKFEEDFKKSVPSHLLCERYKDSPVQFKRVNNPADYLINSGKFILLVECKSVKGISLPLKNIRDDQVWAMLTRTCKLNTFGGFLINLRQLNETYFVFVEDYVYWLLFVHDRESLSLEWLRKHGYKISQKKKIKRYKYGIQGLLDWVEQQKYVEGGS